jgi:tetratricopeptide (TPR) repeat protein
MNDDGMDEEFHRFMAELREESRQRRERMKDPQGYLEYAHALVARNPADADAYIERSWAWDTIGHKDMALEDMDRAVALDPRMGTHELRAYVLRDLGRYREALDDLNRAEACDPQLWATGYGLLFRADCHARLGDEAAALADCARLRDDHWTPGMMGAPKGTKAKVAEELRRRAAAARSTRTPPGSS